MGRLSEFAIDAVGLHPVACECELVVRERATLRLLTAKNVSLGQRQDYYIRHSSLATHARNLRDSNTEKGPLLGLIYREKGLGLIGGKSLVGFSGQFVGANTGLLYKTLLSSDTCKEPQRL